MNEQTYRDYPEVVDALKKVGPVALDPSVPDDTVRLTADVHPEHAARVSEALRREIEAVNKAIDVTTVRARAWDWRSGTPNPKLSGPPKDR